MAADKGAIRDLHLILRATALERHVKVARRDQSLPTQNPVAIARLTDRDLTFLIEAPGKGPGKVLRHVLHDDNRRGEGWQRRQ